MKITRGLIFYLLSAFVVMMPVTQGFAETEPAPPKLKDVINDEAVQGSSVAIVTGAETKKLVKVGPDDELGRGVPRRSMMGFFQVLEVGDLDTAAKYLDLRNLPDGFNRKSGPELARRLKVVLDRVLWVDMDLLSTNPKGHSEDGLPSYRDLLGQVNIAGKNIDILLQRVPRGDGIYIWKISSRTVRDIPGLYEAFGDGPVGEKLSAFFPTLAIGGLEIWQWFYLLMILLAGVVAAYPFVRLLAWLIQRKQKSAFRHLLARFIRGPMFLLIVIIFTRVNFDLIHPSLTARAIFEAGTIAVITGVWIAVSVVGLFREFWTQRLEEQDRDHAIVLLRPAATVIRIVIVFIGMLIWLDNIGFSVTTVLAGLGIGGIALALATQKSIEDFIGAMTLYLAAPVKVGDFCKFGDKMGVVEEIGLRSTKIRTLEETVVIIPNSEFSTAQIENLTERKRYRFNPKVPLGIDVSPDQIRFIVVEMKRVLHAHEKVSELPLRVSFIGFAQRSLDIEVHCYINTTDINEFKGVAEDLNLRFMDIVVLAGATIAINATIEYKGDSIRSDEEAKHLTEERVDSWRQDGRFSQSLSEAEIDEIRDSITYPATSK